MNEEIQMRMFAMELAVKYLSNVAQADADDGPVAIAKEIFEFIQGETK
jgi:hypothetical protein